MYRLYYSKGACSLAVHIVLREAGLPFTLEPVNIKTHHYRGGNFKDINPLGYVPVLELPSGERLREIPVILQYLADQVPNRGLIPASDGTLQRYRALEWVAFVSSEIHRNFGPLWLPDAPEATKARALSRLRDRFGFLDSHLERNSFLLGATFSVADAYLYTTLHWSKYLHLDLAPWSHLGRYVEALAARPSVGESQRAEGERA